MWTRLTEYILFILMFSRMIRWSVLAVLLVAVILYLLLGGVVFHFLEAGDGKDTRVKTSQFHVDFLSKYTLSLIMCLTNLTLTGLKDIYVHPWLRDWKDIYVPLL